MADRTLPLFTHPAFPQVFAKAMDRFVGAALALDLCEYESPESRPGACDGEPCSQKGAIYHLESERLLCCRHFRKEAIRG